MSRTVRITLQGQETYLGISQCTVKKLGEKPLNKEIFQEAIAILRVIQLAEDGTAKLHYRMREAGFRIVQKIKQGAHGSGKEFLGNIRPQRVGSLMVKTQTRRGINMLQKKRAGLQNIHQIELKLGLGLPVAARGP